MNTVPLKNNIARTTNKTNTNNDDQPQKTIKRKQPKQDREDNPSTIKQILATQLAKGNITPEIYLEAVSKLKKNHENVSIPIYG